MAATPDLERIAAEPLGKRIGAYWRMTGPGYMQSAMTLGGGSVASCAAVGSLLGYELLWVQPLAMMLGFFVLAAIAKQVCATGERPYDVFWTRLHPFFALAWGVSAIVATVLWHIPQYSLTANGVVALGEGAGVNLDTQGTRIAIGAVVLLSACAVVYMYSRGAAGLKWYERAVKSLVWAIVIAFALVVITTGVRWGDLFLGITGVSFLQRVFSAEGVPPAAIGPIVGGMAAAVGINMVFLYPYSLLRKNWGKHHKELAFFDLLSGMALPFILATGFMIIAVANTVGPDPGDVGSKLEGAQSIRDIRQIIPVLAPTFGNFVGEGNGESVARLLIGLGMAAIGFSTIITHMLAGGFIGAEMLPDRYEKQARLIFTLLPAIGVVGVVMPFPITLAITASTLAAPLMPLTVACFLVLLNKKSFMGDAMPTGGYRILWNTMLAASVIIMSFAAYLALKDNWGKLKTEMGWASNVAHAAEKAPADAAPLTVSMPDGLDTRYAVFTHDAMATEWSFVLYARPQDQTPGELRSIADEAFAVIDDIEGRISRWKPGSQASEVNRRAAESPVRISPDFMEMLRIARTVSDETGGAFDVSVMPLIALWKEAAQANALPEDAAVAAAKGLVGMDRVVLDPKASTVAFKEAGMALDFGAIGKGFALDKAAEAIKRHGITTALLHGGTSSIVAIGAPPGTTGWSVGIRDPHDETQLLDDFRIADHALSTSAQGRPIVVDGEELGHIIDPKTGRPAHSDVLSATVIAPTAALADALSTAVFVMGVERTKVYCQDHPDAVVMVSGPGGTAWFNRVPGSVDGKSTFSGRS